MKRPTAAAARTISLFTGKTDLEDPLRGRDGTLPEELRRQPRHVSTLYVWHLNGGHFAWAYGKPAPNNAHVDRGWIQRNHENEYHAWAVSLRGKARVFTSLIAAAEWVEEKVWQLP